MGKFWKYALLVVSWPLLAVLLFFTGKTPKPGVRWPDANHGRAIVLAVTLRIWSLAVLLTLIWVVVFSVVVPMIIKRRNGQAEA
jgi:hypothetical protein